MVTKINQNRSNICPKTNIELKFTENRAWRASGRLLGSSWIQNASQQPPGWVHIAFGLGILGRLWGILGRVGPKQWPTRFQLGS